MLVHTFLSDPYFLPRHQISLLSLVHQGYTVIMYTEMENFLDVPLRQCSLQQAATFKKDPSAFMHSTLNEKGGWWFDLGLVCLQPLPDLPRILVAGPEATPWLEPYSSTTEASVVKAIAWDLGSLTDHQINQEILHPDSPLGRFCDRFPLPKAVLFTLTTPWSEKKTIQKRTWIPLLEQQGIQHVHILGESEEAREDEHTKIVPVKEDYRLLSKKVFCAFQRILRDYPNVETIIKCDDDNFVRVDLFCRLLKIERIVGGAMMQTKKNYDFVGWRGLKSDRSWKGPWVEGYLYWASRSVITTYTAKVTEEDLERNEIEDKLFTDTLRCCGKLMPEDKWILQGYPAYFGVSYLHHRNESIASLRTKSAVVVTNCKVDDLLFLASHRN